MRGFSILEVFWRMDDRYYMQRALALAKRGLGWTSPNPAVGAVVVRDGQIVGEGYHQKAGEPHAEVHALRQAGARARGSTLYVTLEPCNHYGRTPPCTEAILAAGVRRVVAATADANPAVRGRGLLELLRAGLEVQVGVGRQEARRLNDAFAKYITTHLPWVSLKMAMSLDGKVATRTGDSRWITGPAARRVGHELRHRHDAVLVGIGTVLADNPRLTVRLCGGRNPVRLVLDSSLRLPLQARLVGEAPAAPTWVITTPRHDPQRRNLLEEIGVEVVVVPGEGRRVDLPAMLELLGKQGIASVLVEGGPTVNAAFLEAGLVDQVYLFLAPRILGGARAPGAISGAGVAKVAEGRRLKGVRVEQVGEDWLISGYPEGEGRGPDGYWTQP
jgi:diaminohydroxyphosphoribosylaminopyrimidine deaminase/5-amino-6-(5-phosphoribosylamino)uracil reductase